MGYQNLHVDEQDAEETLPDDAPVSEGDPTVDAPVGEENLPDKMPDCGKDIPVNARGKEPEQVPVDISDTDPSKSAKPHEVDSVRHSVRNRMKPERLQYSHLGNPLLSIVQSLFQGLSLAFTDVFQETKDPESCLRPTFQVVSTQSLPCNGRA